MTAPDSVSFKYTLTESDFVKASQFIARSNWVNWIRWSLTAGFTLVVVIILLACADTAASTHWSYKGLPVLVAVMWLAEWLRYSITPRLMARRTPTALTEIDATFSDEGVSKRSELANSDSKWKAYTKALESRDYFLLHASKYLFFPFPKRCLAYSGDIDRLRSLIRAHVSDAKLLDQRA